MSHTSLPTDLPHPADFAFLGEVPLEIPKADPVGRGLGALTQNMRGQLMAAMKADEVGVRDLGRALGISPSAVSRFLRSAGDLKISTAVLLAHALGRRWNVELVDRVQASVQRNFPVVVPRGSLEEDASYQVPNAQVSGGMVGQPDPRPLISIAVL